VSVIEQRLPPSELEIVVIDDGSTGSTPSIIQKFVPRVKLRKNNEGQASAFNAGFSEALGQFVGLFVGDDWWAKGKIAHVVKAFGTPSSEELRAPPPGSPNCGSRLKAFQTEMLFFRSAYKNPTFCYRLFKYLVVGAATLLLPPPILQIARLVWTRKPKTLP